MATPDEIRRLEQNLREAQDALTRARAENQRANEAWERMLRQAEQSTAQGKSVSAEFIVTAAARARARQGAVVPLHQWRGNVPAALPPKDRR